MKEFKSSTQLSDWAMQLTAQYPLGALLAEYPKKRVTWEDKSILIFGGTVLVSLVLLSGVIIYFTWSMPQISLPPLVFNLIIIITLIYVFSNIRRKDAILLSTEGILFVWGHRVKPLTWDKITEIKQSSYSINTTISYAYSLLLTNGKKMAFDHRTQNAAELARYIERLIMQRRFPSLLEEYQSGKKVSFGPLVLSQEGMQKGKDLFQWETITCIRIYNGYFMLHQNDQWIRPFLRVAKIPNIFTFIALLHHTTNIPIIYR